jgi:MBG domain (YGX type)/Putative Ig domain
MHSRMRERAKWPARWARPVGATLLVGAVVTGSGSAVVALSPGTALAQTCGDSWTAGAGTTDWNTAGNWSDGVPTSGVEACIDGSNDVVVISGSTAAQADGLDVGSSNSLTIDSGGSLTSGAGITSAGSFDVAGSLQASGLTLTGGTFTDDDSTAGSVVLGGGGLTEAGNLCGYPVELTSPSYLDFQGSEAPSCSGTTGGLIVVAGSGQTTTPGFIPAGYSVTVDAGAGLTAGNSIINDGSLTVYGASGVNSITTCSSCDLDNYGTLDVPANGAAATFATNLVNEPQASSGYEVVTVEGDLSLPGGSVTNAGSFDVAPGATLSSSQLDLSPGGTLEFGIAGPPSDQANYADISASQFNLGGTVAPTLEGGYIPPAGSEYEMTGAWTGSFSAVTGSFTADYSNPNKVGLLYLTALSIGSPSAGTYGTTYSNPVITGGLAPYQVTVTTGTLPPGLTFATNGTLSGTPTQAGTFTFGVSVTDSSGVTTSGQVTVVVNPANLTITASNGSMTYGGTPPAITPAYSGFVNGDTAASLATAPSCSANATSSSPAGNSYVSSCTGAADPNYTITYVNGTVTVGPAPLTITASSATTTYGSPPPAVTAIYSGFVNGDSAKSLTTPPTCSTTETASSPPGTYPTTCSGAVDPNYSISYVNGTITVGGQAATSLAYTGTTQLTTPATLVPAASLSSSAAACQAAQPVSFTLNENPTTGAAGTYSLETATTNSAGTATGAAVSTSGWLAGSYMITATYAGTTNCAGSQASAVLAVAAPGTAAIGAGTYTVSAAGAVAMGFVVAQVPKTTSYTGKLAIVNGSRWSFSASVTSYTKSSSTAGKLAGTGTLSFWNPTLNKGHGGWQVAATRVSYTAVFTATTKTAKASFGITIAYTPSAGQPSPLPNSGATTLTTGGITMS